MPGPLRRRRPPLGFATLALVACLGGSARAIPPPPLPAGLPPAARARILEVAAGADVAARGQARPFVTRRPIFEYLLDHPDFATHVTRALLKDRLRIWRTTGGYALDDDRGATGQFAVIHAAEGMRVMRARGQYKKGVLPAIGGEAAIVIEYGLAPADAGRSVVRSIVSGFVRLDSRLLAMALHLATTLTQGKADREAQNLMRVFAKVSKALEADPAGAYRKIQKMPGVPATQLEEFRRLLSAR